MVTRLNRQAAAVSKARQQVRLQTASWAALIGAAQEVEVDSITDRAEVTAKGRAGEGEEMAVQTRRRAGQRADRCMQQDTRA